MKLDIDISNGITRWFICILFGDLEMDFCGEIKMKA